MFRFLLFLVILYGSCFMAKTAKGGRLLKLYCPTGGDRHLHVWDWEVKNGALMDKFQLQCQCYSFNCQWRPYQAKYGCSSFLGAFIENEFNAKDACRIHDMCYETGRPQEVCDIEFRHNLEQICNVTESETSCDLAAGLAYTAVYHNGEDYIEPCTLCEKCPEDRQCNHGFYEILHKIEKNGWAQFIDDNRVNQDFPIHV